MFNYIAILPISGAVLCLGLGLFTLSRNPRNPANIGFALGMATLVVVELGNAVVLFSSLNQAAALSGMRFSLIGQSFMPVAWLMFSVFFARGNHGDLLSKWTPVFLVLSVTAIYFANQSVSTEFLAMRHLEDGSVLFTIGTLGRYFNIYLIVGLVLSLVNLESSIRSSGGDERWQIKYLVIGVGGILFFFIYLASQSLLFSLIDIRILPVTSAVILMSVTMMGFFIVRYRLLSVDIFISRYVVYNSLTVLVVGLYLLMVGLVTQGIKYFQIPSNYFFSALFFFISLLLLMVLFFATSLRRKAQLFINRHFYKHKYEFRDTWMESIENISPKRTEEEIKKTLIKMIVDKMGAKPCHLWLYDPVSKNYHSTDSMLPEEESRIGSSHPLIKIIKEKMNPFLIRDIVNNEQTGTDSKLTDMVNSTRAVLCSPLVAGHDVVGFIMQGGDLSGEPYGIDDFQLLKALTTQAAVQIKNTRLAQNLIASKEIDVFSKMSSFIMHDLKNLTNSLSLLSQNARQNMDNPEFQKDAMNTIDQTITRMKTLIDKLSTVRKGVELKMETVEIIQLINNALAKLAPSRKKDVIITTKVDDLPLVSVDRESIEMVILNVLTNAYDSIEGNGKIEVKALSNGKNVNIKISDTGVGMSDDFIEQSLFRPFKSTKSAGFGIGLYQCKDVVEAHGGRIDVESVQGKGTTFTIILPVNMADESE